MKVEGSFGSSEPEMVELRIHEMVELRMPGRRKKGKRQGHRPAPQESRLQPLQGSVWKSPVR